MSLKLPPFPTEYLEIIFLDEKANMKEFSKLQHGQILPFAASGIINASLQSASNIIEGDDVKTVTEICLNLQEDCLAYQPGYTIGILPENSNIEIKKLINRLNYNKFCDTLFTLAVKDTNTKKKFKIPPHIPVAGCIKDMLTYNLDIRSTPKKTFLRALTKYTANEDEVNKLNELCSLEGSAKYLQFITSDYITLIELLKIFPSCYPPFTVLLEHLPRLLPRPYSITCSPLQFNPPNSEIHFIYSTRTITCIYEGVCSAWMNKLVNKFLETNAEITIPCYLRKPNNFILPAESETNLIMIGTGTGIAPFISFLRHKELEKNEKSGSVWLFYGCRYSNRDFIYKNEIENWANSGIITKLFTSFSRENSTSSTKYVQENLQTNCQDLVDMLDKNTVVYVCGGKNMCNDVFQTIIQCVREIKNISLPEAQFYVNKFKKSNKYIEDIWD